jgi:primosomal protein N''
MRVLPLKYSVELTGQIVALVLSMISMMDDQLKRELIKIVVDLLSTPGSQLARLSIDEALIRSLASQLNRLMEEFGQTIDDLVEFVNGDLQRMQWLQERLASARQILEQDDDVILL